MDEEIRAAIAEAKEQQPVAIDLGWHQGNVKLDDVKQYIRANINSASRSFVAIGYYLKYIRDNQMYTQDGYESIWELAQAEFGISKSQASKFMSINDRFSKDGNSPILLDQYKDFSSSKLSEMLYLTDEQLEQVTIGTTVAQIREIRKTDGVVSTSKQEQHNEAWFVKQYFDSHPEDLAKLMRICREHKSKGDAAKAFQEYKARYGYSCSSCSDWDYTFRGFATGVEWEIGKEKIHMKYGRLVEEALKLYDPADRKYDDILEPVNAEPENVDTEPEFVNDVDENIIKTSESLIEESENVIETVEADIVQTEPEEEYDFDRVSAYELKDIKVAIRKCQENLAAYLDCKVDAPVVKREKMYMDALQALEENMYMHDIPEPKPEQPELPILRNNDQRGAFIDAYTTWPIWIDIKETEERYFRYNLPDGVSMVVKVYYTRIFDYMTPGLDYKERYRDGWGKEEYYLMKTDRHFEECKTNRSNLIDYLKDLQKKKEA